MIPFTAEHVHNPRVALINRTNTQSRRWLRHQIETHDRGGIHQEAKKQFEERTKVNRPEQASRVAMGLVASQTWHRMEKEREAEKAKAGGVEYVGDWWTPHEKGQTSGKMRRKRRRIDDHLLGVAAAASGKGGSGGQSDEEEEEEAEDEDDEGGVAVAAGLVESVEEDVMEGIEGSKEEEVAVEGSSTPAMMSLVMR